MKPKILTKAIVSFSLIIGVGKNEVLISSETKKQTFMKNIHYKVITIENLDVFYRVAGDKNNPHILFLHGFPSSSHMFRDIMAEMSENYHVIAPDYPGFGQSSAPSVDEFDYTFENLSIIVERFIDALDLKEIHLYMQDYGGPVGLRIANRRPELFQSLLIQNANAYDEGLGEAVQPFLNYINDQNPETEKEVRNFLTLEATKWQYTDGAENSTRVSPDAYIVDHYYLNRQGNDKIQLALFKDYGTNFKLYNKWHQYFRSYQPPTLIIWGKNDKIFIKEGADAYKKDLPDAELHFINGGHFLLEEHFYEVSRIVDKFISKINEIK